MKAFDGQGPDPVRCSRIDSGGDLKKGSLFVDVFGLVVVELMGRDDLAADGGLGVVVAQDGALDLAAGDSFLYKSLTVVPEGLMEGREESLRVS